MTIFSQLVVLKFKKKSINLRHTHTQIILYTNTNLKGFAHELSSFLCGFGVWGCRELVPIVFKSSVVTG